MDAVRVLGVVAVVAGHVWSNSISVALFYPWHVALFFFLAGYLWNNKRNIGEEVAVRWRTILIPYIAWLGIIGAAYWAFLVVTHNFTLGSVAYTVYGGYFATRPFTAFWFVSVLFFTAVLYRTCQAVGPWVAPAVGVLGLVASYFFGLQMAKTPLGVALAAPCLLFFLAGECFKKYRSLLRHPQVAAAVTLTACAALVASGISRPLNIKHGDFGTPILSVVVSVLIPAAMVVLAEGLISKASPKLATSVSRLAEAALVVVLTHAAVLFVLHTDDSGGIIDLFAALVAPWALGLALLRSHRTAWLAGKRTRKAPEVVVMPDSQN